MRDFRPFIKAVMRSLPQRMSFERLWLVYRLFLLLDRSKIFFELMWAKVTWWFLCVLEFLKIVQLKFLSSHISNWHCSSFESFGHSLSWLFFKASWWISFFSINDWLLISKGNRIWKDKIFSSSSEGNIWSQKTCVFILISHLAHKLLSFENFVCGIDVLLYFRLSLSAFSCKTQCSLRTLSSRMMDFWSFNRHWISTKVRTHTSILNILQNLDAPWRHHTLRSLSLSSSLKHSHSRIFLNSPLNQLINTSMHLMTCCIYLWTKSHPLFHQNLSLFVIEKLWIWPF